MKHPKQNQALTALFCWLAAGLLVALAVAFHGCTPSPDAAQKSAVPAIPGPKVSWPFSDLARADITLNMLNSSPGALCPNYGTKMDKTEFWVALAGAVAYAESGWKAQPSPFLETGIQNLDPVTHLPVYSEGLYSLSYQDKVHVYYSTLPACQKIDYAAKNLKDATINTDCSMAIWSFRLGKYGPDVREALAPYWSSLNPKNTKAPNDGYAVMLAKLKVLAPGCGT